MSRQFRFHEAAVQSAPGEAHPGGVPLADFNLANREVRRRILRGQADGIRAPYGPDRATADVLITTERLDRLSMDVEARLKGPRASLEGLRGAVRRAREVHRKLAQEHLIRALAVRQRSLLEQWAAGLRENPDLPGVQARVVGVCILVGSLLGAACA
ncbi:MAG: hypothetical protein AB1758_30430, partial [Candidatus Eremiobacterota bacterium]